MVNPTHTKVSASRRDRKSPTKGRATRRCAIAAGVISSAELSREPTARTASAILKATKTIGAIRHPDFLGVSLPALGYQYTAFAISGKNNFVWKLSNVALKQKGFQKTIGAMHVD